jgi:hypothetical protein
VDLGKNEREEREEKEEKEEKGVGQGGFPSRVVPRL